MKIKPIKDINDLKDFIKSYFSYLKGDCLTTFSNYTELMELIPPILLQSKRKSYFVMESDNFITLIFYNERKEICPILQPIDKKGRDITYIAQELINEKIYFMIDDRNYSKDILKEYNVRFSRECFIAFDKSIISDDWINSSNEIPKKMRKMLRDIESGVIRYDVYNIKDTPDNILNQFYKLSKEWSKNKKDKGLYVSGTANYFKDIMLKGILDSLSIYTIPLTYNNELISLSVVEVLNKRVAFYSEYKNVFQPSDTIPPKYINNAGSLKYYIPIKALIDKGIVNQDFQLLDEDGGEDSFTKIYNKEFEALSPLTKYKLKHNPLYMRPLYIATGINNKRSIF